MGDRQHKIEVLNRFMGWEPCPHDKSADVCDGSLSRGLRTKCGRSTMHGYHHIRLFPCDCKSPFDPYADTPEAREWTNNLEDEYIRRTGKAVTTQRFMKDGKLTTLGRVGPPAGMSLVETAIKHHAILDAIYEAIKYEAK